MDYRQVTIAIAGLLCAAFPVYAQQYPCWNNRGFVERNPQSPNFNRTVRIPDPQSSMTWNQMASSNDPRAVQAMVGTWYSRAVSPQTGQAQDLYASFEPNGLYQYRDQTCGQGNLCSNNQGTGEFRAAFQADGSIFYMINFSDLSRDHQCTSDNVRFQGAGMMVGRNGNIMRKVQ
jgi:hypothetical protein